MRREPRDYLVDRGGVEPAFRAPCQRPNVTTTTETPSCPPCSASEPKRGVEPELFAFRMIAHVEVAKIFQREHDAMRADVFHGRTNAGDVHAIAIGRDSPAVLAIIRHLAQKKSGQ